MDIRQTLEARIRRPDDDGCWGWAGDKTKSGYGVISHEGKRGYAHRASWELEHGPIPAGMEICHHCDNPPCVRPDHLFIGTHADNMRDMWAKGRWHPPVARGEDHPGARLTAVQVAEIRGLDRSIPCAVVGRMFGISSGYAGHLRRGKGWA